jgi:DNA-binding CsgD family transcriptional regulator
MTKAAVDLERGPAASLCRFTLGNMQVEIIRCRAQASEGPVDRQLASFEHEGMQFLVREVESVQQPVDPLHEILTAREREIVRSVATGLRNKQIAYELRLSEYTVAAYIKHICYKLQVRNRTAMVTRCNQLGATLLGDLAEPACRGRDACRRSDGQSL